MSHLTLRDEIVHPLLLVLGSSQESAAQAQLDSIETSTPMERICIYALTNHLRDSPCSSMPKPIFQTVCQKAVPGNEFVPECLQL